VYDRALRRCRACVRNRHYVVTLHAADELEADGYTVADLEAGILTGSIVAVQRDISTRESKYTVRGETTVGRAIEQVVKLGFSGMMVVITVYEP